jgi:hypothetical protein
VPALAVDGVQVLVFVPMAVPPLLLLVVLLYHW